MKERRRPRVPEANASGRHTSHPSVVTAKHNRNHNHVVASEPNTGNLSATSFSYY
jgi:hypothetical protein